MNKIVCRCADVTVSDIKKFIAEYPDMPAQQVKMAMNIGRGCGACNHKDSPVTDVNFYDAIL